ncbi:MAG: hypothetical protein AVDCRST_MAG17-2224, partial [uncultured Solirubrobacterales bacterium]
NDDQRRDEPGRDGRGAKRARGRALPPRRDEACAQDDRVLGLRRSPGRALGRRDSHRRVRRGSRLAVHHHPRRRLHDQSRYREVPTRSWPRGRDQGLLQDHGVHRVRGDGGAGGATVGERV